MTTKHDHDQDGTEVEHGDKIISACRDCGFVHADRVSDYDSVRGGEDDAGFRHYRETGHGCGTFEPKEGSELEEIWAAAYGVSDGEVPDADRVFEMATGVEA